MEMTTWSYSFVWLSLLFVGHIAKQTNGEVSPPWITNQGCYDWNPVFRVKNLSENGPTSCFNECANYTHIGIQANMCACLENLPSNPRIPYFKCQIPSQSAQHMLVYSKVIVLPATINQADYGLVYVSILPTSTFEFHASNSSSEVHGVCYDDGQMKCKCVTATENAESARQRGLISYNGFENACPMVSGNYWIGMFRESPVYSSTAMTTLSTSTSPLPASSTQTIFQPSDKMSFPQSVGNTSSTITQTSSGYQTRDVTTTSLNTEGTSYHEENPDSTWKINNANVDACIDGEKVCNNNGHCTNTKESFSCRCYEGYTGKNCETGLWPGPLFAGVAVAVTVPLTLIITFLIIWRRGVLRFDCSGLGLGPKEKEIACSERHLRTEPASNNNNQSRASDERIYDQPNINMIETNAYLEPTGIQTGNRGGRNQSREYEKLRLNENLGNSLYSSYNENQS